MTYNIEQSAPNHFWRPMERYFVFQGFSVNQIKYSALQIQDHQKLIFQKSYKSSWRHGDLELELTKGLHNGLIYKLKNSAYVTLISMSPEETRKGREVLSLLGSYVFPFNTNMLNIMKFIVSPWKRRSIGVWFIFWKYRKCHYWISSRRRLMFGKLYGILYPSQELCLKWTGRNQASFEIIQNNIKKSVILSFLFSFQDVTFSQHHSQALHCTNIPKN